VTGRRLRNRHYRRFHRGSGKLSYLVYPDFEDDPHPALLRSVRVNLRTRQIDCSDYTQSANPPVLHRKEAFLTPSAPLHAKFARLTAQEEKHGQLDDTSGIGTRDGWTRRLRAMGFALRGHRLVQAHGQKSAPGSLNSCPIPTANHRAGRFGSQKSDPVEARAATA
jgi:DNA phosphorothioation-associated putative methyltransferase